MRVIGVVDLLAGRAVHARARAGARERYEPVRAVAGTAIEPGDARALTHAYVTRLGVAELYVADLDAILGRPPQNTCVGAVASALSTATHDAAAGCRDPSIRAAARSSVGTSSGESRHERRAALAGRRRVVA